MQHAGEHRLEEEVECLPDLAWLLLTVSLLPHLLTLVGLTTLARIASFICFPLSMGPFALAHTYILVNRLGFTSNMAWISAITFTVIWSAFLCWSSKKNRNITVAIGASSFVLTAGWVWLLVTP